MLSQAFIKTRADPSLTVSPSSPHTLTINFLLMGTTCKYHLSATVKMPEVEDSSFRHQTPSHADILLISESDIHIGAADNRNTLDKLYYMKNLNRESSTWVLGNN